AYGGALTNIEDLIEYLLPKEQEISCCFTTEAARTAKIFLHAGIDIWGEPWSRPGAEGGGVLGPPERLNDYANVTFSLRGRDGDELVAYQRRKRTGGGHSLPEREWRNLGVREHPEKALRALREAIFWEEPNGCATFKPQGTLTPAEAVL